MSDQRSAVFLINLIQDVNVLRPLMHMAARDFGFRVLIMVSADLAVRDLFGIWLAEVEILRSELSAHVVTIAGEWDAFQHLDGQGVIFAGSESSLREHSVCHSIFRIAPSSYLKVTLQHGFECVGFRQSLAHDNAHGTQVSFAADVLCAWQEAEHLSALAPSQRSKLHVTGPPSVLQAFTDPFDQDASAPGLVCENLHSVRLRTNGGLKAEFVNVFNEFCRGLGSEAVVLRPHPAGQYVLKHDVAVPSNALINNAPMYRLDLRRFAYGISAPSSVLIDMMLADIPTAVWRDREGEVDADNYASLTTVSTPDEWIDFVRQARHEPQSFIQLQRRFLDQQVMPIEPHDVFNRFAEIFESAQRIGSPPTARMVPRARYLFVANTDLPTLRVCLTRPLGPLINRGEIGAQFLFETDLIRKQRELGSPDAVPDWLDEFLNRSDPDVVIFSRYSGPFGVEVAAWARRQRVPVVYQIDDDLLAVPASLGERKFAYHNDPHRLVAVRSLLGIADVVYASTERLKRRLLDDNPNLAVVAGPINCSGRILQRPAEGSARRIGYMASADHLPNLMMILPAIVSLLKSHPDWSFELFGSIPVPEELAEFHDRIHKIEAVADYDEFLGQLAARRWDIGVCPLTPTDFNLCKSNNKWVEYTSVGAAVIASGAMIYDECCSDGCGILAFDLETWTTGLESLVADDLGRLAMVRRAQVKLEAVYGTVAHRTQVLEVVAIARSRGDPGARLES